MYGRADHAMVACEIKWRIRSPKPVLKKDFSVLFVRMDRGFEYSPEELEWKQKCLGHQDAFKKALEDKQSEINDGVDKPPQTVDQMYSDMCTIIQAAIDTLPDVPKTTHFARETSDKTKALIEERVKLGRRKDRTRKDFKKLQKQIKESGMQDFNMWVEKWVTEM